MLLRILYVLELTPGLHLLQDTSELSFSDGVCVACQEGQGNRFK